MGVNRKTIEIIRKKLTGKELSYREIFTIMDDISNRKLGTIPTTYFAAAGFTAGFSDEELYYLTRAMVETGKTLSFEGVVADKHSTGGVAGTRTTMILVPIIASCGYKIPKNSSRAITTAAGTADTMELLAKVTFPIKKIEYIVNKIGGCIVWGGHLGIAPADDIIIRVEEPMMFESFDKIIVSIMAKKVASGSTHTVFDIPVGSFMKIRHFKDADVISDKFKMLAKKFGMKIAIDINETLEPAGRGVGPTLEARDVLRVLEQAKNRPLALEKKALRLAGRLLNLIFEDDPVKRVMSGEEYAKQQLKSGKALDKFKEIIKEQEGDPEITSESLPLGRYHMGVTATHSGRVISVDNKQINTLARVLGSPDDKKAGIYLLRHLDEKVSKKDPLFTIYSSNRWRFEEAKQTIVHMPIYKVE